MTEETGSGMEKMALERLEHKADCIYYIRKDTEKKIELRYIQREFQAFL